MELKDLIKVINKNFKLVLVITTAMTLIGLGMFFLPTKYIASGAFYINRKVESNKISYFTYEGYYGQQTALSYTNTVSALLEGLDIKKATLEKLNIPVSEYTLRKYTNNTKIKKTGPQIINLTVKQNSAIDARKLWDSYADTLISTTKKINLTGDPLLEVIRVSEQPVIKEMYKSLPLYILIGFLSGITFSAIVIYSKEYFS